MKNTLRRLRRLRFAFACAFFAVVLSGVSPEANAQSSSANGNHANGAAKESPTLRAIVERGAIRLGARDDAIPFSYLLKDGTPVGYSIDLCTRAVDTLRTELRQPRLRIVWVPTRSVGDSIEKLQNGQIDMECGATHVNAAVRAKAAFSVPHFFSMSRVLTLARDAPKRMSDFTGKLLASNKGSAAALRLKEMKDSGMIRFTLQEVDTPSEAFGMLQTGKVDGYAGVEPQLYIWRASQRNPADFSIVGEPNAIEPVALMLPKNDPAFKKRIDVAVSHAMIDGHVTTMYKRWFLLPIPPNNLTINLPMSEMLSSSLLFPSGKDVE